MKTDWSPKRFRKYQERLETHRTSKSLVMTPDCSIDLKRMVSGKGSFTNCCEHAVSNMLRQYSLSLCTALACMKVGRTD